MKPAPVRTPDRDLCTVARFACANAALLAMHGQTVPTFVKKFAELRKKRPGMTAADLIGRSAVARFADTSAITGGRVDRAGLVQWLQKAMPGISGATLQALTTDQLTDLARNLPRR